MRPTSRCVSALLISCAVLANGCHQSQASASRSPDAQASTAGQGTTATSAKAPSQSSPSKSSTRTLDWAEVIEAEVDPAVVTDAGLRDAIKATGLPWRVRDKGTNIEMLLIPPGEFVMGKSRRDDQGEKDEVPAHNVKLTKAFYLGRYEVTQQQYAWVRKLTPSTNAQLLAPTVVEFMLSGATKSEAETNARSWKAPYPAPNAMGKEWPVEMVSWDNCEAFCRMTELRLPTEAEWEYACRAGSRAPRYGELDEIAWWPGNSTPKLSLVGKTHAVGTKRANALGLHDMLGNVAEWVDDWYGDYSADAQSDPQGPREGSARVFRGGSWNPHFGFCRAPLRSSTSPDDYGNYLGFRVARTP